MLDLETARRIVQEIVEEVGPGFRYLPSKDSDQQCFYVPLSTVIEWVNNNDVHPGAEGLDDVVESYDDGVVTFHRGLSNQPRYHTACLVGRVLDRVGETRHRHPTHIHKDVRGLSAVYPDMFTPGALRYLQMVQTYQDSGHLWSVAYQLTEEWWLANLAT